MTGMDANLELTTPVAGLIGSALRQGTRRLRGPQDVRDALIMEIENKRMVVTTTFDGWFNKEACDAGAPALEDRSA